MLGNPLLWEMQLDDWSKQKELTEKKKKTRANEETN